jgi:hypothetical protein
MVVCQFCGSKLMEGAKFCYKCERKLEYPDEKVTASAGIKDSVAMHSPGAGSIYAPTTSVHIGKEEKRYCQRCETPISEKNRSIKCYDCGAQFCAACELDFRTERNPGEKPYCSDCFAKHQELINQEKSRQECNQLEQRRYELNLRDEQKRIVEEKAAKEKQKFEDEHGITYDKSKREAHEKKNQYWGTRNEAIRMLRMAETKEEKEYAKLKVRQMMEEAGEEKEEAKERYKSERKKKWGF